MVHLRKVGFWQTAALCLVGIVMVALTLTGCSTNASTTRNTSKTVSFVKEAKSSGTYIWIKTEADGAIGYRPAKSSIVNAIYVLSHGKLTAYQIQDNNITLGKLSKMNDADTIALAKAQDKKYFKVSADEVRNYMHKKDQIGQQNDFWNTYVRQIVDGGGSIYYTCLGGEEDKTPIHDVKIVSEASFEKQRKEKENGQGKSDNSKEILSEDVKHLLITDEKSGNTYLTEKKMIGDSLINNIEKTKYRKPIEQRITRYKEKKDNSGNKIISQTFSFKNIDYFNADSFNERLYKAIPDKQALASLVTKRFNSDYFEKGQVTPEDVKKVFTPQVFEAATKGMFGYFPWTKALTLKLPISQQIYQTQYIGYILDNSGNSNVFDFLLTKSQVKGQKAVLSK